MLLRLPEDNVDDCVPVFNLQQIAFDNSLGALRKLL